MGVSLCNLGFSNSLRYDTEAQTTKEKIAKLDFIKIKNMHKQTLSREGRKPAEREKLFEDHIADKV